MIAATISRVPGHALELECMGARRVPRAVSLPARDDASSRVLLIGEDNPQSADPSFALWNYPPNCAGERLQRLILNLEPRTYLACWRTNLCNPAWSIRAAQARAAELLAATDAPWTLIVALGSKVAKLLEVEPMSTRLVDGAGWRGAIVAIPHPSGRNRVWNAPEAIATARMLVNLRAPGFGCKTEEAT